MTGGEGAGVGQYNSEAKATLRLQPPQHGGWLVKSKRLKGWRTDVVRTAVVALNGVIA